MGSVSFSNQFRNTNDTGTDHGSWSNWHTGSAFIRQNSNTGYLRTMLIKASVDYSGATSLASVSFTLPAQLNGASYAVVDCYLYTYEPSAPSTSIPGGYVATISSYVTSSSSSVSFSFSGEAITASTIYFIIACEYSVGPTLSAPSSSSAAFNLPPIVMSLSSASVSTGNNQVATFTYGSGRTVNVYIKYNGSTIWSGSTTTGSITIPVSKSWFTSAGITTLTEFYVSIQATEADSGTISDSFKVVAGSDMLPTVGTPTASIVQASGKPTSNFPNTYLANISKAKVQVSVSSGSNASIAAVKLTYTGGSSINMTYNSSTGKYEATTPELVSASTTFTVTVTDSRGLAASNSSSSITVVQYSQPSLSVDAGATFRCDSGGNADSGGAYFLVKATASYYSSLSGNALLQFNVKIQGTQTTYNLTSGVQSGPHGGAMVSTTNYTLEFTIEDKVSNAITKTFPLGSKVRDIVAIHNSTGTALGIGTTPERTAGSSVEMPMGGAFLMGGFPWGTLTLLNGTGTDGAGFSKNFLNVEVNTRYSAKNATAAFDKAANDSSWSNMPASKASVRFVGIREVIWISGNCIMVKLTEILPYGGVIWTSYYNGSSWSEWRYNS